MPSVIYAERLTEAQGDGTSAKIPNLCWRSVQGSAGCLFGSAGDQADRFNPDVAMSARMGRLSADGLETASRGLEARSDSEGIRFIAPGSFGQSTHRTATDARYGTGMMNV